MMIERTHYYAKSGRAEEALAIRRRASLIRIAIGLPAGRIRAKLGGDGPDVTWECAFAGEREHSADLAARANSPEFEAVRKEMRAAIDRFERCVERDAGMADIHWSGDHDLADLAIVPDEVRFRSGDLELAGYLYRPPGPGPFPCMITNHGSGITQGTQGATAIRRANPGARRLARSLARPSMTLSSSSGSIARPTTWWRPSTCCLRIPMWWPSISA